MRYLFYDCECANSFDKISKICSLGYVITDDKFNIIDKKDLLINPEDQFDYHLFSNKSKIHLAYRKKDFYTSPNFKKRYNEILKLFSGDDLIVFGFSLDNDVKFLLDACKRYELPIIKFHYVDVQVLYRHYSCSKENTSLANAIENENIVIDKEILHKSDDDAYLTMLVLKHIMKNLETLSLLDVLHKYNLQIESVDLFLKKAIERNEKKEARKNAYLKSIEKLHLLDDLYDKKSDKPKSMKFDGKSYSFSNQVIRFSDKAIEIQKYIYDNGGVTKRHPDDDTIIILGNKEKESNYEEGKFVWIDSLKG